MTAFWPLGRESPEGLVQRWLKRPEIDEWRSSSAVLHLFLDGLDELPGTIDRFAADLYAFLQEIEPHHDRLRLRLSSRPSVVTSLVLGVLDGYDPIRVSILPLRENDALARRPRSGRSTLLVFCRPSARCAPKPSASRPLTLKLLADEFKDSGSLPTTRTELYGQDVQEVVSPSRGAS